MAGESVDIYYDPVSGKTIIKVEGLPDTECEDLTKFIKGTLKMTDRKVTKTESVEYAGGASRGESVHRG